MDAAMWPRFEQALARYQELESQLGDPAVVADRPRFARTAKEHGKLAKQVKPYVEFKKLLEDLAHAEALAGDTDPELRSYAEKEAAELRSRRDALQTRLEDFLL